MGLVAWFNIVEGVFWLLLAIVASCGSWRPPQTRWRGLLVAGLVAFGISDFIEVHTGAWWRPWWLAAGKVTCVAVVLLAWWRLRRQSTTRSAPGRKRSSSRRPVA